MLDTTPRRKDRTLSTDAALALLDAAEFGILSMTSPDGTPYGIPLNFVRDGDTLILHGSTEGRKIDSIRHDNRVSFCVVEKAEPIREKFTTRYESAIVFGRAELVEDDAKKLEALRKLCERFAPENKPNHQDTAARFAEKFLSQTAVILLHVDAVSGKANP